MADEQIVTNIVATSDFSSLIADVQRTTVALSKLQSQLSLSNAALANQAGQIQKGFGETLRSTGQFTSHFVTVGSEVERFGKSLDSGRLKLKDYFRTWQDHTKTSGGLIRGLAKEQVALQQSIVQSLGKSADGMQKFNVHVKTGLDEVANRTALAKKEMQIYNKVIQDGGNQIINWGKNTQWAGRQLTVGLTVPIAAFGVAASKAFRDADQELVRLTKVYGGLAATSQVELDKVRKDVAATAKELAAAYGASYKDTISLAADIAATGKQGNELLQSTKEATRLSILGEVDRQEAMKATLAIQSAFKQNTNELTESINFLNAVENQTSTSLADLVEAIPKAGPVVKALGGDVEDLALYLTAMREGGINASEGANALKSALASIINPTKVAKEQFMGFGIDLSGIVNKNAGNLTATILEIQAALETLDPLKKSQAIEQLFGKFQFARMNALFENLGKQGSQTLQVLDLMKASSQDLANVAGRELSQITESASGRYKRALESLKADLAKVGEEFLKIQTFFIELVDKVINFVTKLPDPIKKVLTLLAGFTAAAGPLIMLTGVFANFFGYVIKGIGHLRALFKGGEGFKLLTPQIVAANQAGSLIEKTFYSDAKAAATLATALSNLNNEFNILYNKANNVMPVAPAISTMANNMFMPGGAQERVVNTQSSMLGKPYSRDMSHMIPSKSPQAGSIFGVLPGTSPVNKRISNNPQIYAAGDMPDIPGLTTVNKVSTGVVASEAAKFHSMTAAIAMQSQSELKELRQEVAATGSITTQLSQSYQTLLPQMTEVIQNAVRQSELIVAETKAGKITLDQAKAKIVALNAQIETMLASTATSVAAAQGRTINVGMVPLTSQPAVDPRTGKSNMKEMFHKAGNANLMNTIARALGVRTSGGGYSTETTMPKRLNEGGFVPGTGNADTHSDTLPAGSYVVNKKSSENPLYRSVLNSMKTGIRFNNGGEVPVLLTPGEFVADPQTAKANAPILKAINSGTYNPFALGGTVTANKMNYGIRSTKQGSKNPAIIEAALAQVISFNTDKNYAKNTYTGAVLNDSWAIYDALSSAMGRPADPKEAISIAEAMEEEARSAATFGGVLDEKEYSKVAKEQMSTWKKKLKEQYPNIRLTSSTKRQNATSPAVRKLIHAYMLKDKRFSRDFLKTLDVSEGGNAVRAHRDQLSQSSDKINPYKYLRAAVVTPTNVNYESKQLQDYYGIDNYQDRVSMGPKQAEEDAKKLLKGVGFNSLSSYEKYLKEKKEKKEAAKAPKKYKEFLAARTIGKPSLFTPALALRRGKGGGIQSLAASAINRLTAKWPAPMQFYKPGFQYKLGNQDPLHGPLQIGLSQNLKQYAGSASRDPYFRESIVYKDDRFNRINIMDAFLTGTAEKRGKYATAQYMEGNLDIMSQMERLGNHPLGPIAAMKSVQKKFTGNLYRGLKLDKTFKGLPKDVIDAILVARATGDASGLIGKEFIMRRSSWSKSPTIASFFGSGAKTDPNSLVIEAKVRNRNILPAGDMFPDKKFMAPYGQDWSGGKLGLQYRSEQEALFGGKFRILGLQNGKLQVETVVDGARVDGGDTQAGKSYLVGEDGPEIFVPKTDGTVIPNQGGARRMGALAANYGGSMLGYGLASKMAPGNMLAQIGGGLLGDVAGNALYNKIMRVGVAAGTATSKTSMLVKAFQFFIKMPGPVKLLAGLAGVGMAIQAVNKKLEEHKRIIGSAFGLESTTVAKLGLQYTTLEQRMKDYRKSVDLANASAAAFKYTTNKVGGAQGIDMTQEELDALKKSSKKDFKTEISMFNTASLDELPQKATQLKAMFVSSGMAVQDANELIYALILNSNKAEGALTALGDKGFGSIQDKGTAAAATLKTYYSVIAKGNSDQIGKSVDSVLNAYTNLETSLVNVTDKTKPIVTESDAYLKVINKIKNSNAGNVELGNDMYLALSRQNAELGKIINSTDTFASVLAKTKLATSGLSLDLANMGSSAATALSIVVSQQQDTLGSASGPFAQLAKDIQNTGKASADQIVKTSQISADAINKQIELHNKNIKKIKEEADARKKALDENLSDETTLLQIKKKQMEYADAVAAGDMSRAAQAQLDIQGLTRAQEVTVAKRSIDDKAEKDIKKQQDAIDALNKKLDGLQKTVNSAQASAAASQKKSSDLQAMMDELVALTVAAGDGVDEKESARRDVLINKLTKAGYKDIAAKITGGAKPSFVNNFQGGVDNLAALGTSSFGQAYNASKKALAVYITDPETISLLNGLKKGETPGFQPPKGTPNTPIINPKDPVKDVSKEKTILEAAKAAAGGKKKTTMVDINGIAYEIFKYGNSQYLMPKGTSGSEIYEYLFADGRISLGKRVKDLKRNYSLGGPVFGAGTATSDSIPAMLSNGEYVINAASVQAYGKEVFDQFNNRKFAMGGMVNPSFNIPSGSVSLGNNSGSRYNGGGQVYNYSAGGIVINPAPGQNEKQIAEYVVSIMDAKNGLRRASTGDKGRFLQT